jgi:tetratricopeptide (TPR) repeat protein
MVRYKEAIESCKYAIFLKPDYADAYFNLGVVYLATTNKVAAALEQHTRLKSLNQQLAGEFFNAIYRDKVLSAVPKSAVGFFSERRNNSVKREFDR